MSISDGTASRTSYQTLIVVIMLFVIFCVLPCAFCWILGLFGYATDRVVQ
jgi:membrane protein YqaA with SNARE-associated domain